MSQGLRPGIYFVLRESPYRRHYTSFMASSSASGWDSPASATEKLGPSRDIVDDSVCYSVNLGLKALERFFYKRDSLAPLFEKSVVTAPI